MSALLNDLRVLFERFERAGEAASAVVVRDAMRAVALMKTDAATDVLAERRRQVELEGWSHQNDDAHSLGQMALAGAAYATHAAALSDASLTVANLGMKLWPWQWAWWKPRTPREDLVRAGALILAEIERLDRKAVKP